MSTHYEFVSIYNALYEDGEIMNQIKNMKLERTMSKMRNDIPECDAAGDNYLKNFELNTRESHLVVALKSIDFDEFLYFLENSEDLCEDKPEDIKVEILSQYTCTCDNETEEISEWRLFLFDIVIEVKSKTTCNKITGRCTYSNEIHELSNFDDKQEACRP